MGHRPLSPLQLPPRPSRPAPLGRATLPPLPFRNPAHDVGQVVPLSRADVPQDAELYRGRWCEDARPRRGGDVPTTASPSSGVGVEGQAAAWIDVSQADVL